MIGDRERECDLRIGCLFEEGRSVGAFLVHDLLGLFRGGFNRWEDDAMFGDTGIL